MAEAKLSSKNQIVIPREACEALGIGAGDRILMVVHNSTVILLPKPSNHAEAIGGIGRGIYPRKYLSKEHASWD